MSSLLLQTLMIHGEKNHEKNLSDYRVGICTVGLLGSAGERSDLEMHFVNKTDEGNAVVLAVSIMTGAANDAFLPITESEFEEDVPIEVNLGNLLPEKTHSFRYTGSTTTPPCSGGVKWNLFKQYVELSAEQIESIRDEIWGLNDGFDNNRPIQNREGRWITNAK